MVKVMVVQLWAFEVKAMHPEEWIKETITAPCAGMPAGRQPPSHGPGGKGEGRGQVDRSISGAP